jgi:hypothetical protein
MFKCNGSCMVPVMWAISEPGPQTHNKARPCDFAQGPLVIDEGPSPILTSWGREFQWILLNGKECDGF